MGDTPASSAPLIARWRWGIVWLLFLATVINYMDRQAVSNCSKFIMREFDLTESGYADVENAFAYTFAVSQLFAGYLADRFALRWIYAAALVVWSAAGFATGLVRTIEALFVCRILLGVGESFNWPCAAGTIRRVVPRDARPLANGIFQSGTAIGSIVTPVLVLLLAGPDGGDWRHVFLVVGGVGALWAVLWLGALRGERAAVVDAPPPPDPGEAAGARQPFLRVFADRRVWIAIVVGGSVNLCWHFFRVWLPRYLDRDLHFDPTTQVQYVLMAFYVAADLGSIAAGLATRRLIGRGVPVERARQWVLLGTAGLCLLGIPGAALAEPWLTLPLFFLVAAGSMGGFANYFALCQEVAPGHAAQTIGLTGFTSWMMVALNNKIVGPAADQSGTFVPQLMAICLVPLIGAVASFGWPRERRDGAIGSQ